MLTIKYQGIKILDISSYLKKTTTQKQKKTNKEFQWNKLSSYLFQVKLNSIQQTSV